MEDVKFAMEDVKFIMCHGSANRFVMIDTIAHSFSFEGVAEFVRRACEATRSDGVLFLVEYNEGMAMRMFNTDGSEAEMCGNGMRCCARLADEEYLHAPNYTLYSGGGRYPITRYKPLADGVEAYGVEIPIRYSSADFCLSDGEFIDKPIEALKEGLTFTYLNLGNPHIVTRVEEIDYDLLSMMGERVKELKDIFPNGVNVSCMQHLGGDSIFVATYERGVGLTASCGTAMTASSTTASLLGLCGWDNPIEVRNRGGFVKCVTHQQGGLRTELIGNATYEYRGRITPSFEIIIEQHEEAEVAAWERLIKS